MFATIMTIINITALVCVGVGLFISRYTIVDLETWNTIATFYNEHNEEDEEVASGNVGFFWDYISDVEEEEEPEEEGDE